MPKKAARIGQIKRVGSRKFIEANCGYMIAGVKRGTGKFILIEVFCGFRRIDDFERYHGVQKLRIDLSQNFSNTRLKKPVVAVLVKTPEILVRDRNDFAILNLLLSFVIPQIADIEQFPLIKRPKPIKFFRPF